MSAPTERKVVVIPESLQDPNMDYRFLAWQLVFAYFEDIPADNLRLDPQAGAEVFFTVSSENISGISNVKYSPEPKSVNRLAPQCFNHKRLPDEKDWSVSLGVSYSEEDSRYQPDIIFLDLSYYTKGKIEEVPFVSIQAKPVYNEDQILQSIALTSAYDERSIFADPEFAWKFVYVFGAFLYQTDPE